MATCWHCFQEVNTFPCPVCGYDGTEAANYPRALPCGSILCGRYTVGRVLGHGGFGITYIAQDYRSGERVAIKEYFPRDFASRNGRFVVPDDGAAGAYYRPGLDNFLAEAKTLAGFNGNAHIVRVHAYFEENDTAYFAMEYVDGVPLNRYLAGLDRPLGLQEINDLLFPLMEALEQVHACGIIHRDIAPDNIILDKSGAAKLIDFGAARDSTSRNTHTLDRVRKVGFSPFEQIQTGGRQGPWTDVYAMAATYYYMLTGKVPLDCIDRLADDRLVPPSALGAAISPQQEAVLLRALAVMPEGRYQTMAEFRRDMRAASAPKKRRTCWNCFLEVEGDGPCPHCGWSPESERNHTLALHPGGVLNRRYTVGRVLGMGGIVITYIAQDRATGERVAIRELFPTVLARRTDVGGVTIPDDCRDEFDRLKAAALEEAGRLQSFSGSDHFPKIYGCFEENGTVYLAREYLEGTKLDHYLRDTGPLSPKEADRLLLPLMEALEGLHEKGVIHRAVAPDNILVMPDGSAKLIGFDLAGGWEDPRTVTVGPPKFSAIEQYARRKAQGPWTDVYAMAATYYYCITGKVPPMAVERVAEDPIIAPGDLGVSISPAGEAALMKGLAVRPEGRWQTMAEFRQALRDENIIGDPPPRDPRLLTAFMAALALTLVVFSVIRLADYNRRKNSGGEPPRAEASAAAQLTEAPAPAAVEMQEPEPTQEPISEGPVTWSFDEQTGTLTISGRGAMEDYSDKGAPWYARREQIRRVVIGPGVQRIGKYAFHDCVNLTSVTIPDGVTEIGYSAFSNCAGLTSVSLPDSVTSIEGFAFEDCIGLESVNIPSRLTVISEAAFAQCKALTEITIPDSVTGIGAGGFSNCVSLTDIEIPESVTIIDIYAFTGCNALTHVTVPDGVTDLTCVFRGCRQLESVAIPASVTAIGNAFQDCDSLTDIYYAGTRAQWQTLLNSYEYGNEPLMNATIHYGA